MKKCPFVLMVFLTVLGLQVYSAPQTNRPACHCAGKNECGCSSALNTAAGRSLLAQPTPSSSAARTPSSRLNAPDTFPSFGIGWKISEMALNLNNHLIRSHLGLLPRNKGEENAGIGHLRNAPGIHRSFWVAHFGGWSDTKEHGVFPGAKGHTLGGGIGVDFKRTQDRIFGGVISYGYQDLDTKARGVKTGSGKVHQEMVGFYGKSRFSNFIMDFALNGGLYQYKTERLIVEAPDKILENSGTIRGATITPHVEIAQYLDGNHVTWVPFVSLDFFNVFQGKLNESGPGSIAVDKKHAALLRPECGVKLHYRNVRKIGEWIFCSGLSYINKTPIHSKGTTVDIKENRVHAITTLFPKKSENLCGFCFQTAFKPTKNRPEISLDYSGEFSRNDISHLLSLGIKKLF